MTLNRLPGFRLLFCLLSVAAFFAVLDFSGSFHAQTKQQIPGRTGYVNDFAGVVDEATKQRLEGILQNLKVKSGIEFDLVAVQTTEGKDIFDYSRQLAMEWNVGARSSKKSLLLVVSVVEKTVFTQFSRSVQRELPEGILGELSLRMRDSIDSGKFSEGLSDSVQHFIDALSKQSGLNLQDIDQTVAATPADAAASNQAPLQKATDEAGPALGGPAIKVSNDNQTRQRTTRFAAKKLNPSPAMKMSQRKWN